MPSRPLSPIPICAERLPDCEYSPAFPDDGPTAVRVCRSARFRRPPLPSELRLLRSVIPSVLRKRSLSRTGGSGSWSARPMTPRITLSASAAGCRQDRATDLRPSRSAGRPTVGLRGGRQGRSSAATPQRYRALHLDPGDQQQAVGTVRLREAVELLNGSASGATA